MEVGAVKQAFNNEVIHLKKNLNQAKIQTIHKLTRKAKTLNDKKAPGALKEKLKRKAESAVNEVLIIKKIKPRDIAKFTVTHKGNLNDYLNKPDIDQNKACARLLLHKALQEKYKLIRDRFGNISINDLLMSRQERRKLKKELLEKQKEKKKVKLKSDSNATKLIGEADHDLSRATKEGPNIDMIVENGNSGVSGDESGDGSDYSDVNDVDGENENISTEMNKTAVNSDSEVDKASSSDNDDVVQMANDSSSVGKFVRPLQDDQDDNYRPVAEQLVRSNKNVIENITPKVHDKIPPKLENKSKKPDKRKENKNKNIKEKILNRNFNKKVNESPIMAKVVDPFFVTSTGDNYLSLAEPRAPDEVKEVHKQGNRQYRRAVMFGHVPKIKPRKNNYDNNSKFNNQDNPKFQQNAFNKSNPRKFNNNDKKLNNFDKSENVMNHKTDEKPEKLHPSWEAKRKHSSILPFQGKKIVFDDS